MGLSRTQVPPLQRSQSPHQTSSDRSDRRPVHAGAAVPVLELLWMGRKYAPCVCSPRFSVQADVHEVLSQGNGADAAVHAPGSSSGSSAGDIDFSNWAARALVNRCGHDLAIADERAQLRGGAHVEPGAFIDVGSHRYAQLQP